MNRCVRAHDKVETPSAKLNSSDKSYWVTPAVFKLVGVSRSKWNPNTYISQYTAIPNTIYNSIRQNISAYYKPLSGLLFQEPSRRTTLKFIELHLEARILRYT
jgi:hypothetical protein